MDGKSQDGSLGHSDNIHQLNEFNSRPPLTLPVFVLLEGFVFQSTIGKMCVVCLGIY